MSRSYTAFANPRVVAEWVARYEAGESTYDIVATPGCGIERVSQGVVMRALKAAGVLRTREAAREIVAQKKKPPAR